MCSRSTTPTCASRCRTPIRRSAHRQVHVVGVVAGRVAAAAGVRLPAAAGQPDPPEPDHVQDPEPARIADEVTGQVVAVALAAARRDTAETPLVGGEVAGPALGMLTAVLLPEAVHV